MTGKEEYPLLTEDVMCEAHVYRRLATLMSNRRSGKREDIQTTPLMTLAVKDTVQDTSENSDCPEHKQSDGKTFNQYAVLGFHVGEHAQINEDEPILMNIDAPTSAFICGSQGSGKSYTLCCMLENCLMAAASIGRVIEPLAGVVFNYNPGCTPTASEAAFLCSMAIPVNVLVSQSNIHALQKAYSSIPGASERLTISPLLLSPSDLSIERMHKLMAFSDKQNSMPLYMSVILRILRQMAIKAGANAFDYVSFKKAVQNENLTKDQLIPLEMRLELLESFMDTRKKKNAGESKSLFELKPGTLTIIDLTDPFMDSTTACILFEICLSLVGERRAASGLVVALDEAHKYMTNSLAAASFTDRLLGTIREQRHNATRVIVATQEPTISERLMDLCTVSIVHRFTSPTWFSAIRKHLGAASGLNSTVSEQDDLFERIMHLGVGESLLFAPSAFLCLSGAGTVARLGRAIIRMQTRVRLSNDGGLSALAYLQSSKGKSGEEVIHRHHDDAQSSRTTSPVGQGVTIPLHERTQTTRRNDPRLDRSKAHLLLTCCSCESILLIQFGQSSLPGLPIDQSQAIRAGAAYATCIRCQLKEAETKTAAKQLDFRRGKAFREGELDVDHELHDNLCTTIAQALGREMPVLRSDGQTAYLFLRIVQRILSRKDSLWTVRKSQGGKSNLGAVLAVHQDGVFLYHP